MTRTTAVVLGGACYLLSSSFNPCQAGTFVINYTNIVVVDHDDMMEARVGTQAEYCCDKVDSDDNTWKVDTKLKVWSEEVWGTPKNGSRDQLYLGKLVTISPDQHGAFSTFEKCLPFAPTDPMIYTGYGQAAILPDEFANKPDGPHEADCQGEPDPNGPGEGGDEHPTWEEDGTPILLDLLFGGFMLTDLASGVSFDLNGDGSPERVSWTSPDGGDGWLALDRNNNGMIDDGTELFGNFTSQPEGEELHGYRALAVFDALSEGGDDDGWISQADLIYGSLFVWHDSSQDGISQAGELRDLVSAGVLKIDLSPVVSRRKDRHGNDFRYSSRVQLERGVTTSADVFLLVESGE